MFFSSSIAFLRESDDIFQVEKNHISTNRKCFPDNLSFLWGGRREKTPFGPLKNRFHCSSFVVPKKRFRGETKRCGSLFKTFFVPFCRITYVAASGTYENKNILCSKGLKRDLTKF